jgi:hypothetical protein
MKVASLITLVFATACGDPLDTGGDSKHPGDDSADDTGTQETWSPASIKPGGYLMTFNSIDTDTSTCDNPVGEGDTIIAKVTAGADQTSLLWGYAPLETNEDATKLRADGSKDETLDTCTFTHAVTSLGTMQDDKHFKLDVTESYENFAGDCSASPISAACTFAYNGTFEWTPPPDTGDTGA